MKSYNVHMIQFESEIIFLNKCKFSDYFCFRKEDWNIGNNRVLSFSKLHIGQSTYNEINFLEIARWKRRHIGSFSIELPVAVTLWTFIFIGIVSENMWFLVFKDLDIINGLKAKFTLLCYDFCLPVSLDQLQISWPT